MNKRRVLFFEPRIATTFLLCLATYDSDRGSSRNADADDGEETAGHGAFLAIAENEIAVTGGAKIVGEDVLRAEAGVEKLRAIGFAEVQENVFRWRLMAGRLHVEPLKRIWLVAGAEFVEPS